MNFAGAEIPLRNLIYAAMVWTILFSSQQIVNSQTPAKTSKDNPSIYLSYDSKATRRSRCKDADSEHLILQLHNNSDHYINISADFNADLKSKVVDGVFALPDGASDETLKPGSEVEVCYDQEGQYTRKGYDIPKKTKPRDGINLYCSCSFLSNNKTLEYPNNIGYWIKPNSYIKFAVPSELLTKNVKIYTEFNYPWEFSGGKLRNNEPRHRVYFYFQDLPAL
jgi:hypothetical protein